MMDCMCLDLKRVVQFMVDRVGGVMTVTNFNVLNDAQGLSRQWKYYRRCSYIVKDLVFG